MATAATFASAALSCGTSPRQELASRDGGVLPGTFADAGIMAADGATSGGDPRCPKETQYVFVIDADGVLYRFDPPSASFTSVGPIKCSGAVYSMAIDRNAFAWVLQVTGALVKVDTRDASCKPTAFLPNQQGFSVNFGMGFSTDAIGGTDEKLFVSDAIFPSLATIDTSTLTLTKVGPYDKLKARAELTGTGDARLFGAFEGSPYSVAQIDKASAKLISQAPQSSINYDPGSSNFAFAFWGGVFYLFVGPGTSTDVFKFDPADSTTKLVASVPQRIVGAGVSTCAPTTAPK